jgi:hypothetical protein
MRLIWMAILTAHGTAAVAWWWLLPGGFGVGESRFWVNGALPLLILAWVVVVRFGVWRRESVRRTMLAALPAMWLAAGFTARAAFPRSAAGVWLVPVAFGAAMAAALAWEWRRGGGTTRRWAALTAAVGAAIGVWVPIAERGADPDTRPASSSVIAADTIESPADARAIPLSPDVKVDPADPVVTLLNGRVTLAVQPVLTFVSRSPDRCWTVFARKPDRDGPPRRLTGLTRQQGGQGGDVRLVHRNDLTSLTDFAVRDDVLAIDSTTHLPREIYSHLNTFAELTISGHRQLEVAFSPCPDVRVEFRPFQVRGELPGRCAYLAADGTFRVVQATRAEKGPFTTLARGRLAPGRPLAMTFFDQGRPRFEVVLDDWSAQAAVQPSPTAGYGLPVNAVEFSLDGDSARSAAGMFVTLAGTSVGRGWDSVGHRAGTYRNRMRMRVLRE